MTYYKNLITSTLLDIGPYALSKRRWRNRNFLLSSWKLLRTIKNSIPRIWQSIPHIKWGAGRKVSFQYQDTLWTFLLQWKLSNSSDIWLASTSQWYISNHNYIACQFILYIAHSDSSFHYPTCFLKLKLKNSTKNCFYWV